MSSTSSQNLLHPICYSLGAILTCLFLDQGLFTNFSIMKINIVNIIRLVNAIAHRVLGEIPEEDQYLLQYAPPFEEHVCQQNGLETIIKVAKLEMRKKVH